MITIYRREGSGIAGYTLPPHEPIPQDALWIDLLNPENGEQQAVSQKLGIELPDKLDMQEIEASSRLYTEGSAIYLTMDVLVGFDTPDAALGALLIVFTPSCLITMRYCAPRSMTLFVTRITNHPELFGSIVDGLLTLLDTITDRMADILETLSQQTDAVSRQVFRRSLPEGSKHKIRHQEKQLQQILHDIGIAGEMTHKIRSSLGGMIRLASFLGSCFVPRLKPEQLVNFHALERDLRSLSEHAQFAAHETTFLLEATLGQINIEQNNIIKIFSVVAVVFLPPTLFASMWGMNFHNIPELSWDHGYYIALGVMLISAVLPIAYFRHKGWL